MGSKLKKLLMGLVLIPSLTLTAACGKDDDGNEGSAGNAKAYSTLQTLSNEMLDESKVIAFDVTSEESMTVDFGDTSKYSATVQAALAIVAAGYTQEEPIIEKEQYGFDFTNGVGYGLTYGDAQKSYVDDGYYIIKNGDNYILYETYYDSYLEENDNSAHYVSKDHLKAEYYEDLMEYLFLLDLVADNEQLADLKAAISEYFGEEMEMEETAFTISKFKITKSKGVSKLEFVASANIYADFLAEDDATEDEEPMMTMTIGLSISFDSEKIIEIVTEVSVAVSMEYPLSEIDPSLTDKISMNVAENVKMTIDNFSTTLDSSIMEADYSSFVTGTIKKQSSNVNYYIDGKEVRYYEGRFQDALTLLTSGAEELGDYAHAIITSWYLDEECTIPATNITAFSSYDIDLYGKITGVNEGYVLFRSKQTAQYSDGDTQTFVGHDFIDISYTTTMTVAQLKDSYRPKIASNIKVNGEAVADDYVFNFVGGTIYEIEFDYTY